MGGWGRVRFGMPTGKSKWLGMFTVLATVATLLGPVSAQAMEAAKPVDPHKVWSPTDTKLPHTPSVKGEKAPGPSKAKLHYKVPANWAGPAAQAVAASGAATTAVPGTAADGQSSMARAGELPVWVGMVRTKSGPRISRAGVSPQAAGTPITVRVEAAGVASKTGIRGSVVSVARGSAGPAGQVQIGVDVSSLDATYGGDVALRSRLVELPACALTSPQKPGCLKKTPIPSRYDPATHRLVADVEVPAATGTGTTPTAATASADASSFTAGTVVLAADTTSGGGGGTYAATSLNPSEGWTSGSSSGGFSYGYPIQVPPALGGGAPRVVLSYDSSSQDGLTSSTNSQSSWIGDGWDYTPGFVERSYKSCDKDGLTHSGDACWGGYNAVLSLGGHSSELVRDDTTGTWRLKDDDGSKVEFLTGAVNGVDNGEYVRVTTTSGNVYYFGLNHLPGGDKTDPATHSAWTEPVYSPHSGDPCYDSAQGTASWCTMGWRWNLDYAVDPHGNLTTYTYTTQSNSYDRGAGQNNGNGTLTSYIRAGALTSIAYGQRLPDQVTAKGALNAAAKVVFNSAPEGRCSTAGGFTCTGATLSSANAAHWPDVPYDQNCASSGTCTNYGPSFWSNIRLASITTQVLTSGAYQDIDTYALSQSYPNPNDGNKPTMWLDSITRTGKDGIPAVSLPAVTFTPAELPNRVDGTNLVPAPTAFNRPRIQSITTETGGQIQVDYSLPACSRVNNVMPASADSDTMACYNVKWYPPGSVYGADPVSDWFNRYQVDSVAENDPVAHSTSQVAQYTYGPAAWHYNDDELADPKTRTWDRFRGYATVTATVGNGQDGPVSQTKTTYLQGMDQDRTASGGAKSVTVTDSLSDAVTDSDWLSGQTLETDTYDHAGGNVVAYAVNTSSGPSTTATHVRGSGLPDLVARYAATKQVAVSKALKADGGWRTNTTTTLSDSDHGNRVTSVDALADGQPEQCTHTFYATGADPLTMDLVDETRTLTGDCSATASATDTVSDLRTLFDGKTFGSAGTPGDPTSGQVLDHYDSTGTPVYATTATTTYDAYGRTTSTTDPSTTDAQHPNGATSSTAYTSANAGELPTTVTLTSPAPGSTTDWTTTTKLDLGRGLELSSTDVNGRTTSEGYDPLGRLTKLWKPGRTTAQNPSTTYGYQVNGSSGPSVVTTSALQNDSPYYVVSAEYFDGFGRARQTQSTPGVSAYHGRVVTDSFYDSHGRVIETRSPYYDDSAAPGSGLFATQDNTDNQVPGETSTIYDGQGRVTATVFSSYAVEQWRTSYSYPGADKTNVTPPSGGTPTTTITDSLGRTRQLWQYKTPTATGTAGDADITTYTYTPSGKPASSTDATGTNTWTYAYDLRGRQISATDPDTGTTTSTYDADNRLATTTDARKVTLSYAYDLIGRKTAEHSTTYPSTTPVLQATWTYDTLSGAKGYPVAATRYVGGDTANPYSTTVVGYDTAYRSLGTTLSIPATEGALAGTYTTQARYDAINGEMTSSHTDARGDLPSETIAYSYDTTGNRTGMTQHDITGNTANDVTTTQVFAPAGQTNQPTTAAGTGGGTGGPHALLSTSSTGPNNPGASAYQYDAIGDTTAVTATSGTTTMTWDAEDRLASTTATGSSGSTTYLYDADGNQLIRRDPGTTTLTFGNDELILATATNTVTDTRTYDLPNGLTAVRQGTNITWHVADNHGTDTLALDATTLAESRRPLDPFGNPRGTQPTSWAGDHGFVGGTQDPATGLTNLGAREYQPATGRFLNPDPLLDTAQPQQWNGYAYSGNAPTNSTDPTGLMNKDSSGGECDSICQANNSFHLYCQTHSDLSQCNPDAPSYTKQDRADGLSHWLDRMTKQVARRAVSTVKRIAKEDGDAIRCVGLVSHCGDAVRDTEDEAKSLNPVTTYHSFKEEYRAARNGHSAEVAGDLTFAILTVVVTRKVVPEGVLPGKAARCSFAPETPVLMADGGNKKIADVKAGDRVEAGDPATGEHDGSRTVTEQWINHDTDLLDLTIRGADGKSATLHTTANHPFWDDTTHTWTRADTLKSGDRLNTDTKQHATVLSLRTTPGTADRYNLTVDQLHTYYVLAGATPVLVHNCNGIDPVTGGIENRLYNQIENAHGTDVAEGVDYMVQRMHDGSATATDHVIPGIGHDPAALGNYLASWHGKLTFRDTRTGSLVAYDQSRGVLVVQNSYMVHAFKYNYDSFVNSGRYVSAKP